MQKQKICKLYLGSKTIQIPLEFPLTADIDPNINTQLITDKQYIVRSNVKEETLEKFIDYCLNKKLESFRPDSIENMNY